MVFWLKLNNINLLKSLKINCKWFSTHFSKVESLIIDNSHKKVVQIKLKWKIKNRELKYNVKRLRCW